MLIYDRRRCRPPQATEVRTRLTLPQRARLGQLEAEGWRLLFMRRETSLAFVTHELNGHAALARDGRMIVLRTLPLRQDEAVGLPGPVPVEASRPIVAQHARA